MAELRLDRDELKPVVKEIVNLVFAELQQFRLLVSGKLALTEPEAAGLLGLHAWQLRDLRLAGKIGHSRIVGNKVRYTVDDLLDYLRQGHEPGTGGR
jgi:hypothetical protein